MLPALHHTGYKPVLRAASRVAQASSQRSIRAARAITGYKPVLLEPVAITGYKPVLLEPVVAITGYKPVLLEPVTRDALDQGQSSGRLQSPAFTGFHSMYCFTRSNSLALRIQWSKDSSCQKRCPVRPKSSFALDAAALFMPRVIRTSGR